MISNRWLEGRKTYWKRLEALLVQAKSGLGRFTGSELQELGLLYRQTASDLSSVIDDPAGAQLAAYLNQLLGRSHNLLYLGRQSQPFDVLHFYRDTYPRVFRGMWTLVALSTAIFLFAGVCGWALTIHSPAFAHRFLGPEMIDSIDHRKMWTESVVAVKPVASSFISTNNLSVAFSLVALGITGIGTIWMMFFNGLLLGVVGAATYKAGMALSLWSFVAPHGVLELPAICIAGAAGLEIARGLFFPGILSRRDSLPQSGRNAVRLMLGAVPMLLVAGVIEAFFSPTKAPVPFKFALASVLLAALLTYLFSAGRQLATADSGL